MTPRDIINEAASQGVTLSIRDGKIKYSGEARAVAAVLPLLRDHKEAIIRELTGGPSGSPLPMPEHLADAILACGYHAPEWTPAGCRAFLADLMREWPDFEVMEWHGCEFPACWPVTLMDAVTSIYAQSLQDQGGGA